VAEPAIDELVQTVRREFAQREAVVQLRVFHDLIACSDDLIVTVELGAPLNDVGGAVRGCGAFASHAALINEYARSVGRA
jgi:hypothetical protein